MQKLNMVDADTLLYQPLDKPRFVVDGLLPTGLIVQLEDYLKEYPDSRLIVIDTLQKVRTASKDNAYASDYGDILILTISCTAYAHDTKACTDHRIFYDDLYKAVLADIQYHARLAYEDREKAVALAVKMKAKAEGNKGKSSAERLKTAKKRYDEVTRLFDRLYEDSVSGRTSNENFHRLMEKYQNEQEQLLGQIQALEAAMQEVKDNQENAVRWAELMAQYVGIQELTAENLNLLVERIEVYDRRETNAGAEQMIKICYRFGGYIGERIFAAKVLKHPKKEHIRQPEERRRNEEVSLVF